MRLKMDGWMDESLGLYSSISPHPLFGPFGTRNGATTPTRPHSVVKQIIGKASECDTIATLVRYSDNIIIRYQRPVQYSAICHEPFAPPPAPDWSVAVLSLFAIG